MGSVDLNSDLGEGFGPWRMGDDDAMLQVVTTVNVACGFHAGDPVIMARTCARAAERGVHVGAHPGPLDLWGFGRRSIAGQDPADLATMVLYQVGALVAIAAREGVRVGHVKLHGSLSNRAAVDAELAAAVADAIRRLDPELRWLVPAGSAMEAAARSAGLRCVREVFADRAYDEAGNLAPRGRDGVLIDDPSEVAARALAMVEEGGVRTPAGSLVPMTVESICVHGDTPQALEAARRVRATLDGAGVRVAAF